VPPHARGGGARRNTIRRTFWGSSPAAWGGPGIEPPAVGATPQAESSGAASSKFLSRQFAQWVAGLRYEDLPAAVVDRVKGLTLQNLASALVGSQLPAGQQAVSLVTSEEVGVRSGATVLVTGSKVTKRAAPFANSEMMLAGGKWDPFRMLTHPGTAII